MPTTVADLVVQALRQNGIETLYCLPGVQNDDFFDALYDHRDSLRPVQVRHEQAAGYMALGAALATGRPQAFCVVPGPGFLNATAALATAYAVGAPVLALVGEIPLPAIGKELGLLHEIPDQLAILRGLTKQAERIAGPGDAADVLYRAFGALHSGRPRPVGLEVPASVWKAPVDEAPESLVVAPTPAPMPASADIERAADLLAAASRPLIVVGGGARDHGAAITRLARQLTAPVVAFRNGQGVVPRDDPLSVGAPVGRELWRTADVVLALGTRLAMQQTQWGTDEALRIIHVDIDGAELGRVTAPEVGIEADLADALPALLAALGDHARDRPEWADETARTEARLAQSYAERLAPQLGWLEAIRAELPAEGIFVDELTQVGYVSRFAWSCTRPRTYLSSGYQGTLGWGFATALGAAHARPEVPVVSISGDGGALYAITELATAVRHAIALTAIVFTDNAFGNVRRFQIENYANRPIASDLTSPDFVHLAESFGARGLRAKTPDELRACLRDSIRNPAPTVIEVPVGDFPSPWDFILMGKARGA